MPNKGYVRMKEIKRNVIRFLRKYQMDYLDVDIDLVID